jgi:hypothetical protein
MSVKYDCEKTGIGEVEAVTVADEKRLRRNNPEGLR